MKKVIWEKGQPSKKEKKKMQAEAVPVGEESIIVDSVYDGVSYNKALKKWKIDSFSGRGRCIETDEYEEWKKIRKEKGRICEEIEKHKRWLAGDEAFKRGNFYGEDLSGFNLCHYTLSGANFECANFSDCVFYDVSFAGCNLSFSNLENAIFVKCDFSGANLSGTNFKKTVLLEDNFSNAKFITAFFYKPVICDPIFFKSDFSYASFNKAFLSMTDLDDEILKFFKCQRENVIYKTDIEESKAIRKIIKRTAKIEDKTEQKKQYTDFIKRREIFLLKMKEKSLPTYSEKEIKEKTEGKTNSDKNETRHRRTYSI